MRNRISTLLFRVRGEVRPLRAFRVLSRDRSRRICRFGWCDFGILSLLGDLSGDHRCDEDDDPKWNPDRCKHDEADEKVGEKVCHIGDIAGEAFLNPLSHGLRGCGSEIRRDHLVDPDLDGAVGHLIVVELQLGFHGLQFVPDF